MNQKKKNVSTKKPSKNNKNSSFDKAEFVKVRLELEQNIRMLTESNRYHKRKIFDLYTIFEISRNFNSLLDYHQLLDTFIFTSLAQVGAMKGAFYLLPYDDRSKFVLTKYKGSGEFPSKRYKFKTGTTLLRNLIRLNRPSPVDELLDGVAAKHEKKILEHFQHGLVVPLMYQSELSGIFIISDKVSEREFTDDDVEFLSILGNQISVAIENTRLYESERRTTQQLRETQQQLVHSERLAALGEMSAKVAHEINNPLGIIKNYLLLANQLITDNPEVVKNLSIVKEEIDRIAKIVSELLDFHRPRGFEFQQVDIAKLINSVLSLMSGQFKALNVKIEKLFDPNTPEIEASPESLKQVFLNLTINAYDVMPNGGELKVIVKPDKHKVVIQFCDTGPGIPREIIPRIFEPFFTTKEPTKGTGLGLSVCYGIIKKHNGSITFKNLENGGCFEISLPVINKN